MDRSLRPLVIALAGVVTASWFAAVWAIQTGPRHQGVAIALYEAAHSFLAQLDSPDVRIPPPATPRSPRSVACPHSLSRGPAWTVRTPDGPPARLSALLCGRELRGLEVESILPGRNLGTLGLRHGDWILSIDGHLPADPVSAAASFGNVITGTPTFLVVLTPEGIHEIIHLRDAEPHRHPLPTR